MARSSYIYIVTGDEKILAAFTVKHELETWLEKDYKDAFYADFKVFRFCHADFTVTDITDDFYE